MDYTKEITLDVNPYGQLPMIRVKQGDASARFIKVTLTKDDEQYIPESGITFLFREHKADGHAVILDSAFIDPELGRYLIVKNNDDTISIELVSQTTTAVGRCDCDLCMLKDDTTLSTIPFVIEVVPAPDVATLIVSTDDFRTMNAAIQQATELIEGVAQSLATLTLSTSWSGSDPYTQNVTVSGYDITEKTKVDIVGDATAINQLCSDGVSTVFITNNNKTLTAYAIGGKPKSALTVQASLYETIDV